MRSRPPLIGVRTLVQVADYQPGSTYGPRILPDYELVWLLQGAARWTSQTLDEAGTVVEERVHRLEPGMLALARKGTRERYQWDADRISQHAYVHFDVEDQGRLGPVADWPVTRSMSDAVILEGLCSYLLDLAGEQSAWARRRSDEMVQLLLDLFVGGTVTRDERFPDQLIPVVEHVAAAWSRDGMGIVTVPELAEAAGLSPGHLHHLFRSRYGCGPARALELVRLASAAVSLQRSNDTLAQIATVAGYSNPYHFSRRFVATYRMPPGRYRATEEFADPMQPIRTTPLLGLANYLLRRTPASALQDRRG